MRSAWRTTKDGTALVAVLTTYWTTVFPLVREELARWRELASAIPDPRVRALALGTLEQEGGLAEGAAIFATLVPGWRPRRRLVTLLVAWQVLYDYLDTLGEQRTTAADDAALYAMLAAALEPADDDGAAAAADGGYASRLAACCRACVAELPSAGVVRPFAVRAALRCAEGQTLTHAVTSGGAGPLRRWALAQPATDGFLWWEVAAGAISSLAVHALLATAALPHATAAGAARVDAAYFPSICALSTLLDSTIDADDDDGTTNHRSTAYYDDAAHVRARLETVTRTAARAARGLPRGRGHVVILAGMTSYYAAAGWSGHERTHRRVAAAVGVAAEPILWTLRARARLVRRRPHRTAMRRAAASVHGGVRDGGGRRVVRGRRLCVRMVRQ